MKPITEEDVVKPINTVDAVPVELAYRANDGIEVWLLWEKADDRVLVVVHDERQSTSFEIAIAPSSALDAFHHPFAYAAFYRVALATERRRDATLVPAA